MKRMLLSVVCLFLLLSGSAMAGNDKPGCKDHPLFPTRMPDYWLQDCMSKDFDMYEFFTLKGPKHPEEGKFTFITYTLEDRKNEQSGLAVVRNYETAIKKIGGRIENIDPQGSGEGSHLDIGHIRGRDHLGQNSVPLGTQQKTDVPPPTKSVDIV